MAGEKLDDEVRLTELESGSGEAKELPPHDRARLTIAVNVLGALALIFFLACLALVYGPDDRANQAKEIFDFVKTMAPPIATLVLGFYFRNESA
ncbi:MAG: hypothetical protein Q8J90_08150 [Gallionella sp.]|nr:hypothetical protein [Gallionella sp.]